MQDANTQPIPHAHVETLTERAVIIPHHSAQPITIRATSFSVIFLAVISALICWTGIMMVIALFIIRAYFPPESKPTTRDNTSCASSCSPSVLASPSLLSEVTHRH